MSLKTELRLENYTFVDFEPSIYTTGAKLIPLLVYVKDKKRYVWIVEEFNDDTYSNDGNVCHPYVLTKNKNNLLGT